MPFRHGRGSVFAEQVRARLASVSAARRDCLLTSRPPCMSPRSKRAPLRGDVGDKFSVGSSKVGSVQLDSAVYVQNLADSRARLASAKAANFKGEGALRQEEHA